MYLSFNVPDRVPTAVQNQDLVHHKDLDQVHVLEIQDQRNIPDQDQEAPTTREGAVLTGSVTCRLEGREKIISVVNF
jgi:hypothetical protein